MNPTNNYRWLRTRRDRNRLDHVMIDKGVPKKNHPQGKFHHIRPRPPADTKRKYRARTIVPLVDFSEET